MCQLNVQIENRLHTAGYKTDRVGDVVRAYAPVYDNRISTTVPTHYDLHEIRSSDEAWEFVDAGFRAQQKTSLNS